MFCLGQHLVREIVPALVCLMLGENMKAEASRFDTQHSEILCPSPDEFVVPPGHISMAETPAGCEIQANELDG